MPDLTPFHLQPDKFKLENQFDIYKIYTPINTADGYHTSRYVEAINQQIYSNAGATKETIQTIANEIILRANKQLDIETFRTDVALLAQNLLYRTSYPVDQHCAIRLGCILTFMEYEHEGKMITENPDKVEIFWQQKKETLAMNNPNAYAFFLQLGIANTPTYSSQSDILTDTDYFSKRDQTLNSLNPQLSSMT